MTYTLEQLREDGPPFAMAMLLKCLEAGEPFVTYGDIGHELEYQFGADKIFSTHIGSVAGSLMDQIIDEDPKAPLINALITRGNGMPGNGVGGYFAARYNNPRFNKWNELPVSTRTKLVDRERKKVFTYKDWDRLNRILFGKAGAQAKLREREGSELDGVSPNGMARGGKGESKEHKDLKEWISKNPKSIGLSKAFGKGDTEVDLFSGDRVDVYFTNGNEHVMVEVKSCRSNDDDFRRGLYQCVKYREIKLAENLPYKAKVRSILVTERDLPPALKTRAAILKVKQKTKLVNKHWKGKV